MMMSALMAGSIKGELLMRRCFTQSPQKKTTTRMIARRTSEHVHIAAEWFTLRKEQARNTKSGV